MRQKIIIFSSIAILVTAGLLLYLYISKPSYSAINALSEDAVAVVFGKNGSEMLHLMEHDDLLWKEVLHTTPMQHFTTYFAYLDSLLQAHDDAKSMFEKECYFALHKCENDSLSILIACTLKGPHERRNVERVMKKSIGQEMEFKRVIHGETICYNVETTDFSYYFAVHGAVFLASPSLSLLQQSIDNLSRGGALSLSNSFVDATALWGRNVNANLYLSYPYFSKVFSSFSESTPLSLLKNLNNFALWSSLDISTKTDTWLLNGYTNVSDSSLLSSLHNQKPVSLDLATFLPENTAFFYAIGYSDAVSFWNTIEQKCVLQSIDYQINLTKFNEKYNINLHNDFAKISGQQLCFAWIDNSPVFYFQVSDTSKAASLMKKLSSKEGELQSTQLTNLLLGENLFKMKPAYWVFHKQYLIFSESNNVLQKITNSNTKKLKINPHYRSLATYMDEVSNITFFCNTSEAWPFFAKNTTYKLSDNKDFFNALNGFSVQFSASDELFYTNIVLRHNDETRQFDTLEINEPNIAEIPSDADTSTLENSAIDEPETTEDEDVTIHPPSKKGSFILDGKMILSPTPVYNQRSKTTNFVVFDDKKNMYLIDKEGGILWEKTLNEQPISTVYEIDYYENRKIQYLFNSSNYLYAVDALGNYVKGYPVKLSQKAQNPIYVVDFQNNKKYSIFWVDEKGAVQCLDKTGKKQNSWKTPTISGKVSHPVQYCSQGNNHFIIVPQDDDNAMIYNEKGDVRMSIKSSFANNPKSDFYINKTNKKGILLTTDTKGSMVYIPEKGEVQKTTFPEVSKNHYFLYNDFNGDGYSDFIYLDANKLNIYDRFQNVILKHAFSKNPSSKPQIFTVSKKNYLTVTVSDENKIYLFDKSGLVKTFDGNTAACMTQIKSTGQTVLVAGKDKKFVLYVIDN